MKTTIKKCKRFFTFAKRSRLCNIKRGSFFKKLIENKEYWHKFTIIRGSTYRKKEVLDAFINAAAPNVFMPVKYHIHGEDSSFLFQAAHPLIKQLISNGLTLTLPSGAKLLLNLQLQECKFVDFPIIPINEIDKVVKKRTNTIEKVVDLRNFVNDPDLEIVYASLTYPIIYMAVISALKRVLAKPSYILLSYNDISDPGIVNALKVFMINLKGLDLRFNHFTWESFSKFPYLKLTDLWLDGNPLCDPRKHTISHVVEQAKKVFPLLTRLDDIDVTTPIGELIPLKNYIAKENYATMVDHFLHHYFNLYESPARMQLSRFYHQEATVSISVCHVGTETANGPSTNEYSKLSRNVLTVSDMTRMYNTLKRGPTDIIQTLTDFPSVMFDPFSFQVDVPLISGKMVVINVCGVFKDFSTQNPGSLFSFDRTFILIPCEAVTGEWKIVNDAWAITNTTSAVAEASFTQVKKPLKSDFAVMINHKLQDKDILKRILSNLTKMNDVWTLKFLNDASWDLEMALQAFTDQFKADLIPGQAFFEPINYLEVNNTI